MHVQLDPEERENKNWEKVSNSWGFGDQQMQSCVCDSGVSPGDCDTCLLGTELLK